MKQFAPAKRKFLFLQGPTGSFFWELGEELRRLGFEVHRINLNGGDAYDWPGEAVNYRGLKSRWPMFIERYLATNRITDLLLFGDCRPMHLVAHGMAKLRGVQIHVFEEGYIRPHWVTMEPDGVNGHSTLSRDPEWLLEQAETLPALPAHPSITASFNRRARDAFHYYFRTVLGKVVFPFYRSHRPNSVMLDGIGWLKKFALGKWTDAQAADALRRIDGQRFFLFPLQLSSDYQIRTHSPFNTIRDALIYVLDSFAEHSRPDDLLLVKEHPLDCQLSSWRAFVTRKAAERGIGDRVIHIAGGDLRELSCRCLGMVTVNSTSGTLALAVNVPVFVMGRAMYDIPGITHQGVLDDFWRAPQRPVTAVYEAFCKVLHSRCLVHGGLASESAIKTLVGSTMARLMDDPAHQPHSQISDEQLHDQAAAAVSASAAALAAGASRIR